MEHYNCGQYYARDAFESIICEISSSCLPKKFCDVYSNKIISDLIYEYCVIRLRFMEKVMRSEGCGELSALSHSHKNNRKTLSK